MRRSLFPLLFLWLPLMAAANLSPIELHQVLDVPGTERGKVAALTLDACGGRFDADLIDFLVAQRIPATVFVTKRWLDRNPAGLALLKTHSDLFELEDHGANHVPAVIGSDRQVYGIAGAADVAHLKRDVSRGAMAVKVATGTVPRWYRGATGEYDPEAIKAIEAMGYRVAGFSVNADSGATLSKERIVARLRKVKHGDIIIAHVNKPDSDTAEGLAVGLKQLLGQGFRFVKLNDAEVRPVQKHRF